MKAMLTGNDETGGDIHLPEASFDGCLAGPPSLIEALASSGGASVAFVE
jgi:hypothetical protein